MHKTSGQTERWGTRVGALKSTGRLIWTALSAEAWADLSVEAWPAANALQPASMPVAADHVPIRTCAAPYICYM